MNFGNILGLLTLAAAEAFGQKVGMPLGVTAPALITFASGLNTLIPSNHSSTISQVLDGMALSIGKATSVPGTVSSGQ